MPFALALLLFWNDMTSTGARDITCAAEALVLALLLAWMSCWRAVFAGRIQGQLARQPTVPWTRRRIWRLIVSQIFLGGTKLVVLPLAILITLPLASTVAFYRNAAVLADREDLDLAQLIDKARKLATLEQRQAWGILLLLAILYFVLVSQSCDSAGGIAATGPRTHRLRIASSVAASPTSYAIPCFGSRRWRWGGSHSTRLSRSCMVFDVSSWSRAKPAMICARPCVLSFVYCRCWS